MREIVSNEIVPEVTNTVKQHQEIEESILKAYELQGKAALSDPYIVNNPYGLAPLASLAMFETDEPSQISVCVKGKTGNADVSYTIDGYNTHHEIQVFGLYADYNNTVILTATDESGQIHEQEINIVTDKIPSQIKYICEISYQKEGAEVMHGLTALNTVYRLVIDENAEVRWYTTIKTLQSSLEEYVGDGTLWFATGIDDENYSIFYHMNYLGKVLGEYHYDDLETHHDATILPNGDIIYYSSETTLHRLTPTTGKLSLFLDFADFLNNHGSVDLRVPSTNDDWLHLNTVDYYIDDKGQESLLISARNQHMVMKLNYLDLTVDWVLSPTVEYENFIQPALEGKYIVPDKNDTDFEWFYSQHEPSVCPDIDNNPNTTDILIFDNGGIRGIVKDELETEENYSRVVHYRINHLDGTVKQIKQFGKELGESGYSYFHGSTQYLENGNILGVFDVFSTDHYVNPAQIIEANENGEIIRIIEHMHYVYRAYRLDIDSFIFDDFKLGTDEGIYYKRHNYDWNEMESMPQAEPLDEVTVQTLQIVDGKLEAKFYAKNTEQAKLIAFNDENVYELPLNCAFSISSALGANLVLDDGEYNLWFSSYYK